MSILSFLAKSLSARRGRRGWDLCGKKIGFKV
jgi:hypothetical protein